MVERLKALPRVVQIGVVLAVLAMCGCCVVVGLALVWPTADVTPTRAAGAVATLRPTFTPTAAATPEPSPTQTPLPPTMAPPPTKDTHLQPTETPIPATDTPVPTPTDTSLPPTGTSTPKPPTVTLPADPDLLDEIRQAGRLVVSTDPNYAPQSFLNDAGELDGFDVNTAQEVARRLGVEVEFVTPDWDMITAGNWGGRWDLSIGSMVPTVQRGEVLWFTDPYYYNPASFAVHEDNTTIETPGDLAGRRLGVCIRSTYEDYMQGALAMVRGEIAYDPPNVGEVQVYSTDQDAIVDLALGDGVRLDAVLSSQFTIRGAIEEGVPLREMGTPAFYEGLVFALDKSRGPSRRMIAELNRSLAAMRADGTLSRLSETWYDADYTSPGASIYTPTPTEAGP
jgi:polar amino acid transport system substrate-binding protein